MDTTHLLQKDITAGFMKYCSKGHTQWNQN